MKIIKVCGVLLVFAVLSAYEPIFPKYRDDFEKNVIHPFYRSTDEYEIRLCD